MSPTVTLTMSLFVRAAFDLGLVLTGLALPFAFLGFLAG